MYLEDLFVVPEKRGLGYGKALLKYVAKLAVQRDCGRMEWICLDWNEPSLKIYRSIGAVPMSDWTVQLILQASQRHVQQEEQPGREEIDEAEPEPRSVRVFESQDAVLGAKIVKSRDFAIFAEVWLR